MPFKPTDWVLGWPRIAQAITEATGTYVSERWLREYAKRFGWKSWLVRQPQTGKDGKPYGKPMVQTVVQSGVAGVTSAQAAINAEEHANKSKAGVASVAVRRANAATVVRAGAAVMSATEAVVAKD